MNNLKILSEPKYRLVRTQLWDEFHSLDQLKSKDTDSL